MHSPPLPIPGALLAIGALRLVPFLLRQGFPSRFSSGLIQVLTKFQSETAVTGRVPREEAPLAPRKAKATMQKEGAEHISQHLLQGAGPRGSPPELMYGNKEARQTQRPVGR